MSEFLMIFRDLIYSSSHVEHITCCMLISNGIIMLMNDSSIELNRKLPHVPKTTRVQKPPTDYQCSISHRIHQYVVANIGENGPRLAIFAKGISLSPQNCKQKYSNCNRNTFM